MKYQSFGTLNMAFIMLMAACGVALKPVVGPLSKIIGSALLLPSGAIAGMVYMLWPMLALLVVGRFGAALWVGLLEGLIVMVTGLYGSHGLLSLATYVLPCLVMDAAFVLVGRHRHPRLYFVPPALANVCGAVLVGWLIKRLPLAPLLISLIPSAIFGGLAGVLAGFLHAGLKKRFPQLDPSGVSTP